MAKILVVTSSVRENRIADTILKTVQGQLAAYPDYEITVADLKELPMPFYNSPVSSSNENFKATDENVIAWGNLVDEADAVLFLVAEYNYSVPAVLKNAVDWLFKPWNNKPVAFVGYGWVGGARAIKHLRDIMGSVIAAKAIETESNLRFTKEIDLDGTVLDQEAITASVNTVLEELKTYIESPVAAAVA